ncbi:hypothetical protein TRVL_03039 [Trypanosoma vivax]|nr:hypothetical protein TRVL_03039 [Trypanosoma vivax]
MKKVNISYNGGFSNLIKVSSTNSFSTHKSIHPPQLFDLYYKIGTSAFKLFAENVNDACVFVECSVNSRPLRPLKGGRCTAYPGKRNILSRTRRQGSVSALLPVEFCAFVSFPHIGLTLEALCSCSLGLLVVDGVSIRRGTVQKTILHDDFRFNDSAAYQGPLLSQQCLSTMLINSGKCLSPVDPHRHEHSFFFDNHVRVWSSKFSRFGHFPVHTVNLEFTEYLCRFLEVYRINDELAHFVEKFAHMVQEKEKRTWSLTLNSIIKSKDPEF